MDPSEINFIAARTNRLIEDIGKLSTKDKPPLLITFFSFILKSNFIYIFLSMDKKDIIEILKEKIQDVRETFPENSKLMYILEKVDFELKMDEISSDSESEFVDNVFDSLYSEEEFLV